MSCLKYTIEENDLDRFDFITGQNFNSFQDVYEYLKNKNFLYLGWTKDKNFLGIKRESKKFDSLLIFQFESKMLSVLVWLEEQYKKEVKK